METKERKGGRTDAFVRSKYFTGTYDGKIKRRERASNETDISPSRNAPLSASFFPDSVAFHRRFERSWCTREKREREKERRKREQNERSLDSLSVQTKNTSPLYLRPLRSRAHAPESLSPSLSAFPILLSVPPSLLHSISLSFRFALPPNRRSPAINKKKKKRKNNENTPCALRVSREKNN